MIPVTKLLELELERPEGDEASTHVSAASGIVHVGDTLFVIADDAKQLNVFPALGKQRGYQVQILEGPVPRSDEERGKNKPDFESIAVLPPSDRFENGALITLASGTKQRDAGVVVALDGDGLPTLAPTQVDLGPLYDALRGRIEGFNAEGACVTGSTFHLFQRGNDDDAVNARIDIDLDAFTSAVADGHAPDVAAIGSITPYDLGQLGGVKLAFSDASPLQDGRIVFTCSAEASGGGDDGKILGSAVGIIGSDGDAEFIEPVDLDAKIEGMTAVSAEDDIRVLLVTDADDPSSPSPLLEARLPDR